MNNSHTSINYTVCNSDASASVEKSVSRFRTSMFCTLLNKDGQESGTKVQ